MYLFGAAAAAQIVHSIAPATNPAPFHGETRVLPQGANLAENFDAYFDNLETTATNGNNITQGTLDHLAWSFTSQHNEVKNFLAELKSTLPSIGGRNNGGGGGGASTGLNTVTATQKETLDRRIAQLQTAIKYKWIQVGF